MSTGKKMLYLKIIRVVKLIDAEVPTNFYNVFSFVEENV